MTVPSSEIEDAEDICATKALDELITLVSSEKVCPDSTLPSARPSVPATSSGLYERVQSSLKRVIGVFSSESPLKKKTQGPLTQATLVEAPKDTLVTGLPPNLDYRLGKPFPAFKKLEGLDYAVDAFCYGPIPNVKGYFLSHFHADHYAGLNKKFQYGPIYCSKITAHLIDIQLKVMHEYIKILPMEQEIELEPGVTVTLLDANHCPGAVMFLFKKEEKETKEVKEEKEKEQGKTSKFILHTGDFRADTRLVASLHLDRFRHGFEKSPMSSLDIVYLDTTYADPEYQFPCQSAVLTELKTWIHRLAILENNRKLVPFQYLIVVGAYTIGKEKVALTVAQALKSRIHVHMAHQRRIYDMYGWREFNSLLEVDSLQARVHIVPMAWLNAEKLSEILSRHGSIATHVIALRPTGWTWSGEGRSGEGEPVKDSSSCHSNLLLQKDDKKTKLEFSCTKLKYHTVDSLGASVTRADRISLYSVPYSEHSSYDELLHFMKAFSIERVIPTVPSRYNLALLNAADSGREKLKQEA